MEQMLGQRWDRGTFLTVPLFGSEECSLLVPFSVPEGRGAGTVLMAHLDTHMHLIILGSCNEHCFPGGSCIHIHRTQTSFSLLSVLEINFRIKGTKANMLLREALSCAAPGSTPCAVIRSFPEFPRRHSLDLPESPDEITDIREPAGK